MSEICPHALRKLEAAVAVGRKKKKRKRKKKKRKKKGKNTCRRWYRLLTLNDVSYLGLC